MHIPTENQEFRKSVYSLISLLDEPDPVVYEKICDSIIKMGSAALPMLEEVLENTFDSQIFERLEDLIQTIHTGEIVRDIKQWKRSETLNLLQLLNILSKYHFRNLDMIKLNEQIASMKKSIWIEMNEDLTSLECIRLVNHFVFKNWGLKSEVSNILEPNVFFINKILENRQAHPAMLGAFYLGVCQWLTLPVYYVGLPENFILAYTNQETYQPQLKANEILFYINPLLDGVIFKKIEIERFLKDHEMVARPHYFEITDNLRVASLLLRQMQIIYQGTGNQANIINVGKLIRIVEE